MWEFLFQQQKWPIVFICAGMIVAAIIDGWKMKVPNWLTFPLIISGWCLGIYYTITDYPYLEDSSNRIWASLAGTALGFLLLSPLLAIGGMGAGDVKMQMGFGSWVGAYFGFHDGLWILTYSFCLGAMIGGILALPRFLWTFRMSMQNVHEITRDISVGIGHAAEKAAARKHRMRLLPYGIPLCMGFVAYLTLRQYAMLPAFLSP